MDTEKLFAFLQSNISRNSLMAIGMLAIVLAAFNLGAPYAWVVALAGFAAVALVTFCHKPTTQPLQQDAWFEAIVTHLEDATGAKIYLRHFQHPDDFLPAHRDALMKIMRSFVKNISENPETFRIVAYRETNAATKDPMQWLRAELEQKMNLDDINQVLAKCVRIIGRQPGANSSSIYIIDDEVALFSHVPSRDRYFLYNIDLSRSLIPRFIGVGIDELFNKA